MAIVTDNTALVIALVADITALADANGGSSVFRHNDQRYDPASMSACLSYGEWRGCDQWRYIPHWHNGHCLCNADASRAGARQYQSRSILSSMMTPRR
jgi:hypothetical protein